jgi:NADPH2:quinone reductase
MKAVVIREHGDASCLKVETDFPKPSLEKGQVLIHNSFAGLNFIDTYYRTGLYNRGPLPIVAGQEGGGIIVEMSPDVENDVGLKVGDEVVYLGAFGSYAEYTAIDASRVVPVPDGISLEIAIACMVQGLTAHYLVTDATAGLISPGEWCLIYSVGSGTCQWASQMAKLQGYKVIGTTSKSKQEHASTSAAACDELIVLDSPPGKSHAKYTDEIVDKVMEITSGQGVKCILDGIGKSTADISLLCLAQRGIWISFGNASGPVPPFQVLRLTPKSAFLTRPKLGDYVATKEELSKRCQHVFGWIREGKIQVTIDKIFDIDQAAEGHEYLESGQSKGKILYKIG